METLPMTIVTTTLLWLHLAAATWLDLRERRIPNIVIASGLLQALTVAVLERGLVGVGTVVLGACVGMLALFPFFLLKVMGAGDAKLLGVVGAFTGAAALPPIFLYTLLAGGLLGVAALLRARLVPTAVANLRNALFAAWLRARGRPISVHEFSIRSAARIPYSPAIVAGVAYWTMLTKG